MTLVLQQYNCTVSNRSSRASNVHGWAARDSACRSKRLAGNGIKPNIGTVPARMLTSSSLVAIVTALGTSSTSEREKRLPRILHRRCLISRNSCTSADSARTSSACNASSRFRFADTRCSTSACNRSMTLAKKPGDQAIDLAA